MSPLKKMGFLTLLVVLSGQPMPVESLNAANFVPSLPAAVTAFMVAPASNTFPVGATDIKMKGDDRIVWMTRG